MSPFSMSDVVVVTLVVVVVVVTVVVIVIIPITNDFTLTSGKKNKLLVQFLTLRIVLIFAWGWGR